LIIGIEGDKPVCCKKGTVSWGREERRQRKEAERGLHERQQSQEGRQQMRGRVAKERQRRRQAAKHAVKQAAKEGLLQKRLGCKGGAGSKRE
jgi:hypothetical protein